MMNIDLNLALKKIIGTILKSVANDNESLSLSFSPVAKIHTSFWRMLEGNGERISSFDHHQKYGLPEPIDAVAKVKNAIVGKTVEGATFDKISGDIKLMFSDHTILEIFNFTGYEVWEVEFEDGTGQLSNYA